MSQNMPLLSRVFGDGGAHQCDRSFADEFTNGAAQPSLP